MPKQSSNQPPEQPKFVDRSSDTEKDLDHVNIILDIISKCFSLKLLFKMLNNNEKKNEPGGCFLFNTAA